MKNSKYFKKSRYLFCSTLLLAFAMVVLCINALGTSLAWFTDSDTLNYEGDTAIVTLHQYQGASEINSYDKIELTGTSSTPISVQNTGSIGVYIRVMITCNWKNISVDYGDVLDYVTFGINTSEWYIPTSSVGGFIYYKGAVASNVTKTIMSSVTISSIPAGAEKVVINVWAEAVQANEYGANAFAASDANLVTSTWLA